MAFITHKSSNFKFIFGTHFYNDVFLKNIFDRVNPKNKMITINNLNKIIKIIIKCKIIYIKLINKRLPKEQEFQNI